MVGAMIEVIVGISATVATGIVAWTGKRLVSKVDKIDVVLRGDGNGNPGLGEKIRDVHAEVKNVGHQLNAHVRESAGWQERIAATEVRCAENHDDEDA